MMIVHACGEGCSYRRGRRLVFVLRGHLYPIEQTRFLPKGIASALCQGGGDPTDIEGPAHDIAPVVRRSEGPTGDEIRTRPGAV